MILGLLADIHEAVDLLRVALARFRAEGVEQVVVLGDVLENGRRIEETCRLLWDANAVGVWGNHDFGLCGQPDAALQAKYSRRVLDFLGSLSPRLEIEGCLFTHVEPWLDPQKFEDLWFFDGIPDTPEKRRRIFAAVSHRLCFAGHFHQWLLATPDHLAEWQGEEPVSLASDGRRFVVIHALCQGHAAVLDTERWLLLPILLDR